MRVGINGFGRIGRLALRAAWSDPTIEIMRINDPAGSAQAMAHLLEFDSVHGRWDQPISSTDDSIVIGDTQIRYTSSADPSRADWDDIDLLIESSGRFRNYATLQPYIDQGVDSIVVSAPLNEADAVNIVMGVNDDIYNSSEHRIITAASCTTNCIAPVVKVLHEGIGIKHGTLTTIHASTNTQTIIDSPHKDLRRARAHSTSLIPTSTGSAKAIGTIFPELLGKLDGIAVRVPLLAPSISDCVFEMSRATSVNEVNDLFKHASIGDLDSILGYETRPLVSVDYKTDPRSAIVDAESTLVTNETQVKVLAWYDNEWGYANRLVELVSKVIKARSRG